MDQNQVDIFNNDQQIPHYAELCNALYERELQALARQSSNSVSRLQRHLRGLSHHIKRAAAQLLSQQAPIKVDIHNGSWQSKQARKCMIGKQDKLKTTAWYKANANMGLPVCVYRQHLGVEHIELDSIDRIDEPSARLHLNKHGWFNFNGETEHQDSAQQRASLLLKPGKATFTAACCGHRWNRKGKCHPRSLSLRELLLSTTINWKTFK